MPLSTVECVRRFVHKRCGRAANVTSTGLELLDYDWYLLAKWQGDTIRVRREPYPSLSSRQHFQTMLWTLKGAGYRPVRLEDQEWVTWTLNPNYYLKHLRQDVHYRGHLITYYYDAQNANWDEIVVVLENGESVAFVPWKRTYSAVVWAWKHKDYAAIIRTAKRSVAASKAAETVKAQVDRLAQKLIPKLLPLRNLSAPIRTPTVIIEPLDSWFHLCIRSPYLSDPLYIRVWEHRLEVCCGTWRVPGLPTVQRKYLWMVENLLRYVPQEELAMAILAS